MKTDQKILLVASAGGHWIQLMRLLPAFERHQLSYLSTFPEAPGGLPSGRYTPVRDASMWDKPALLRQMAQVFLAVARQRPDWVVTTGAAPGYFALVAGKLLGARTIWIDSVANVEELSLAGRKARRWATHWLTQWPQLASPSGPTYLGSVL
jgi:hypothetical protein